MDSDVALKMHWFYINYSQTIKMTLNTFICFWSGLLSVFLCFLTTCRLLTVNILRVGGRYGHNHVHVHDGFFLGLGSACKCSLPTHAVIGHRKSLAADFSQIF